MRKRSREMKVRLTDKEYQEIENTAEKLGMTKQALVVDAVNNAVIIPAEELRMLCMRFAECNRQLRGMATNINQMAYIANLYAKDKTKKLPEEYILLDILDQVRKYKKEGEELWQSIRSLTTRESHTDH